VSVRNGQRSYKTSAEGDIHLASQLRFWHLAASGRPLGLLLSCNLRALRSYQSPGAFLLDVNMGIPASDRERRSAQSGAHLRTTSDHRSCLIHSDARVGRFDGVELEPA
jgi:hypothetical protein